MNSESEDELKLYYAKILKLKEEAIKDQEFERAAHFREIETEISAVMRALRIDWTTRDSDPFHHRLIRSLLSYIRHLQQRVRFLETEIARLLDQ